VLLDLHFSNLLSELQAEAPALAGNLLRNPGNIEFQFPLGTITGFAINGATDANLTSGIQIVIPEPSSLVLVLTGCVAWAALGRRWRGRNTRT
jgi:hypothetical protein